MKTASQGAVWEVPGPWREGEARAAVLSGRRPAVVLSPPTLARRTPDPFHRVRRKVYAGPVAAVDGDSATVA